MKVAGNLHLGSSFMLVTLTSLGILDDLLFVMDEDEHFSAIMPFEQN